MDSNHGWYVVKAETGQCQLVEASKLDTNSQSQQQWGPYDSREAAIARRVGLIRAGKCQPQ